MYLWGNKNNNMTECKCIVWTFTLRNDLKNQKEVRSFETLGQLHKEKFQEQDPTIAQEKKIYQIAWWLKIIQRKEKKCNSGLISYNNSGLVSYYT